MSLRHVPYSMETTSRSRTPKRRRGNHDRDEFSPPSSAGERAWDYLLRRKAEDINDRIHKTKAVEVDCCSLPEDRRGSSNYVPDEGFWIDRTERRQAHRYGEETFGVQSEYDEYESEAPWGRPQLESHCSSYSHHTANKHEGYGRSVPPSLRSEEALLPNVTSYIEDARHYGTRRNNREKAKISKDSEEADHFIEDYYKNVSDVTTDSSYSRHTANKHEGYGRSVPPSLRSEEALMLNVTSYIEDARQYGTWGNNRKKAKISKDSEGADHFIEDYYKNITDDTTDYNTSNDGLSHFRESYMYEESTYHISSQGESYPATRQTYGGKFPGEGSAQGLPSDSEDLRHRIKTNTRRTFSASHSSASTVIPGTHSTTKQTSEKSCSVTTGNHTLIHTLPYPAEGVEVVYTADPVEAEAWLRNNIIDCSASAVGFDIEWKPQFKSKKKGGIENKTAVLQLGLENSCLVLHLHTMKKHPKSLASILKDPNIVKIGSGILQDVMKLKKDMGLECIGLSDTQRIAKSISLPPSQTLGLKSLAKYLLGFQLEKPKSVSMSNWERFPLTIKQIHYAALDAWVGLKIYQHIKAVCGETHQFQDESSKADGNDVKKPAEKISCHICKKKVKDRHGLAQHIRHHSKCECGEYFISKIPKSHRKECPVQNSSATVPVLGGTCGEPGWCQGCGKKCETEERLMKHIREVCHVLCPFCTRLLNSTASSSHIRKCKDYVGEQWQWLARK